MSGSEIASAILVDLIDSIAFNDDSFPYHANYSELKQSTSKKPYRKMKTNPHKKNKSRKQKQKDSKLLSKLYPQLQ
jgi:hypothetical protein